MDKLLKIARDFPSVVYRLSPESLSENQIDVYDLRSDTVRKELFRDKLIPLNSNIRKVLESKILSKNRPIVYNCEDGQIYSLLILRNSDELENTLDCYEDLSNKILVPEITSSGILNVCKQEHHYVQYSINANMLHLPYLLSAVVPEKIRSEVCRDLGFICSELMKYDYLLPQDLFDYVVDTELNKVVLYNYDLTKSKKQKINSKNEFMKHLDFYFPGNSENFKKGLNF
ncbi:hypothetical protein KY334_06135 [Candidatus Woesearchaeota archaeon]|nr:hypothetical protein [Candidatus Woesearchaeota archaeon]